MAMLAPYIDDFPEFVGKGNCDETSTVNPFLPPHPGFGSKGSPKPYDDLIFAQKPPRLRAASGSNFPTRAVIPRERPRPGTPTNVDSRSRTNNPVARYAPWPHCIKSEAPKHKKKKKQHHQTPPKQKKKKTKKKKKKKKKNKNHKKKMR